MQPTFQSTEGTENEAIRRAVDRLPSDRRELLALYYGEGLGLADIASLLGIPEGTVKSRLHHTRKRLREIMEQQTDVRSR